MDKILSFARVPFAGGGQTTNLGNRGVYSDYPPVSQRFWNTPGRLRCTGSRSGRLSSQKILELIYQVN
jgi:hypothetical protein